MTIFRSTNAGIVVMIMCSLSSLELVSASPSVSVPNQESSKLMNFSERKQLRGLESNQATVLRNLQETKEDLEDDLDDLEAEAYDLVVEEEEIEDEVEQVEEELDDLKMDEERGGDADPEDIQEEEELEDELEDLEDQLDEVFQEEEVVDEEIDELVDAIDEMKQPLEQPESSEPKPSKPAETYTPPDDDPIQLEDEEIVEEIEEELAKQEKVAREAVGFGFLLAIGAMIFTAHQMSENPDGIYASVCRLAITITGMVVKIICMPCRKLIGASGHSQYGGHMPISTVDYGYRGTDAGFEMR